MPCQTIQSLISDISEPIKFLKRIPDAMKIRLEDGVYHRDDETGAYVGLHWTMIKS